MKKTFIALAIAALPVAASAEVILYGQIKAGVEVSNIKLGSAANGNGSADNTSDQLGRSARSTTATDITDLGSRIGFKGHEHLGNGLKAIWQLEQKASIAGTDSNWGTRQSFIGLEGGFGKIRAGRLDSSVKSLSSAFDLWEYRNNALGMGVFTRNDKRVISVRYDSPVWSGFSANVQYVPRDNINAADKYTHNEAGKDTYYAGVNYENSGFFGQYAGGFRKNSVGSSGAYKDGQLHRLVAGYGAGNALLAVAGQYGKNWETLGDYAQTLSNGVVTSQMRTDGVNASNVVFGSDAALDSRGVETVEIAATGAYRFGNLTPRVSYAHGFKAKVDGSNVHGTRYNQVVAGVDYDFSKRTTVVASAGWLKGGENGPHRVETVAGLVGLRHKF
ncbi:trimeric porin PorB [Bergeriella denitrificans]|uniref:Porin n=1 Tax=Bergeriella denitrificans TaxID=494 RepID=A0A378UJG7_BERDE|nr:trimeric porin PorB [Bergeriella denitrificans]STZ76873.1 porin [Bergeriella denitrificans]